MAEPNTSSELPAELPDWIKNHVSRYVASNGEEGYLWDASIAGGKGLVPTLLLTTVGRKSGRVLTLPLIFGRAGPRLRHRRLQGWSAGTSRVVPESGGEPGGAGPGQGRKVHCAWAHRSRRGARGAVGEDGGDLRTLRASTRPRTDRQIPVVVLKPV